MRLKKREDFYLSLDRIHEGNVLLQNELQMLKE